MLIFLGIAIFIFGGVNYYHQRILSFTKDPELAQASDTQGDVPVQISIPSIKIDLDVEPGKIKNGVWDISYSQATYLSTSAVPGKNGNTVIYGHNKRVIFGNLPYVSVGQKILVTTQSGKVKTYEVYQKEFVTPDRIDLVSPTNHEELTLFTCWGLFDSQRAVVKAKPID